MIAYENQAKGVAHYVDEAQEFAERFSGIPHTTWTADGEMITLPDGEATGWRLLRFIEKEVETA